VNGTEITIPPMYAKAFVATEGEVLRIIDTKGGQPGDLVAFNADDLSEKLSQARTRVENRKIKLTKGDTLWSNALPPRVMLSIVADTSGEHDLLYVPCCRYALERRFDVSRDGCAEHLAEVLAPWGIGVRDMPDPLNLFFSVTVDGAGEMHIADHSSKPGDFIEFKAEMDCLIGVSTCSVPLAGRENSSYVVQIGR